MNDNDYRQQQELQEELEYICQTALAEASTRTLTECEISAIRYAAGMVNPKESDNEIF